MGLHFSLSPVAGRLLVCSCPAVIGGASLFWELVAVFYIWTEEEFTEALKRVFVEYYGGGELIYCSDGMWIAYFADADTFAARVLEWDFLNNGLPDGIESSVIFGEISDAYEVARDVIEANSTVYRLDPWGVLHGLLAFDAHGEPRAYYDMDKDSDRLFYYLEWIDLLERPADDEPEWLDAYLAGVPMEDLANGLPPDGLLR